MRYVHTNLVAQDWRRLAAFYEEVFGCVPVPPERSLDGDWLARGTGVPGAALEGVHLRLPGHGGDGPTLEIFAYRDTRDRPAAAPNDRGYGHLAFEVVDVARTLERVVAAGGEALGELVERDVEGAGTLRFVYARDPEGNVLELQRWTTRELDASEAYARWAEVYDADANRTRDADHAVVRAWLDAVGIEGLDVVELGCGTGKNTALLAGARRAVGLDLSRQMLARAEARAPFAELIAHDLREPWPLPDGGFDRALANLVLEHVRDVRPLLRELGRVLRPGGRALIVELHPYRQLRGGQARFRDPRSGEPLRVEAYPHALSELTAAALDAGLAIEGLGEHGDAGEPAPPGALPRLLSLRLRGG